MHDRIVPDHKLEEPDFQGAIGMQAFNTNIPGSEQYNHFWKAEKMVYFGFVLRIDCRFLVFWGMGMA
jgi:hypothetical protein